MKARIVMMIQDALCVETTQWNGEQVLLLLRKMMNTAQNLRFLWKGHQMTTYSESPM